MSLTTFRTIELVETEAEPTGPQQWQTAFFAETESAASSWMVDGWPTQIGEPVRGHRSYAALGIDHEFASSLAGKLWRCGLDCQVIDGLPFALARSIAHTSSASPVAVIDWGDSAMTLTVVVDGRPYYTRILRDCGLRALASAMMTPLQLEAEQCRQLVESYGFSQSSSAIESGEMSAVLAEIASPYLERLEEELRKTWAFLQHLPGQTPTRVILMGGGATLKSSAAIVRRALQLPTEVWGMPRTTTTVSDRPSSNMALFGPAMALAQLARTR